MSRQDEILASLFKDPWQVVKFVPSEQDSVTSQGLPTVAFITVATEGVEEEIVPVCIVGQCGKETEQDYKNAYVLSTAPDSLRVLDRIWCAFVNGDYRSSNTRYNLCAEIERIMRKAGGKETG